MKLQTRRVAGKAPLRKRNKDQKTWALKLYILMYLLVVVSIVFAVANYRIDLNSKINELQRAGNRAKQEIYELERDIQNLKIKKESLASWSNIRSNIARYNLPFRASEAQQVRRLTIRSYRSIPLDNDMRHEKNLSWAQ